MDSCLRTTMTVDIINGKCCNRLFRVTELKRRRTDVLYAKSAKSAKEVIRIIARHFLGALFVYSSRRGGTMSVNAGLRISLIQMEKLRDLASQLGVSRNRVIGILIDHAEVESIPAINVSISNEKLATASVSQDQAGSEFSDSAN